MKFMKVPLWPRKWQILVNDTLSLEKKMYFSIMGIISYVRQKQLLNSNFLCLNYCFVCSMNIELHVLNSPNVTEDTCICPPHSVQWILLFIFWCGIIRLIFIYNNYVFLVGKHNILSMKYSTISPVVNLALKYILFNISVTTAFFFS